MKRTAKASADTGLVGAWATEAAPPPDLTVSQWADEKRKLPESSAASGSAWRNADVPYLVGVMDAEHEPGVKTIIVQKGAQVGGSEAMHNSIGYHIDHDPCPMLVVHPTVEVAEEWSRERFADMVRSTPSLSALVRERRAPRSAGGHDEDGSTLKLKMYPGGFLAVGGSNTANTFARRAVRRAYGDDIERWPGDVDEEGNPVDLLFNRIKTFFDGVMTLVSTPGLVDGLTDTLYKSSDQRRYFMPCRACGRMDYFTWSDPKHFSVKFDDRDPDTARIVCPDENNGGCGAAHYEPDRRRMVKLGEWRPTALPVDLGAVGFHLPATISLLGSVTLPYLVEKWLAARAKGHQSLRAFINTELGEAWEERGKRSDPQILLERRESYGDGIEVPAWAPFLTAGVDAQPDRFELTVFGWGMVEERCVVDHRVIPGDIERQETRDALLEALGRRYVHASGHMLPIHATCLDTGHAAQQLYQFVLANQHRRIYAVKGFADRNGEPIVGKPSKKTYGREPRPVLLYPVNVDDAKANIYSALAQVAPGPSYIHFPNHLESVDEEYFAQLCAEQRIKVYGRGVGKRAKVVIGEKWQKLRDRNEALDCAVYALAAYRLQNPNIRQLSDIIARTPVVKPAMPARGDASTAQAGTQPPRQRQRRHSLADFE